MQNLDVPANWEDAEDARLESRQAVASLIHSPRARERFMADDASLSSAHSRQTSAYGGHPPKEPVSLPEHRFQYHHSFPTGLHEKRTHSAPSRRSPPLVAVHSNSVNHNGCISSSVPWSFDPPPPPRSENHVSLKRATHVPIPSWVPQPQTELDGVYLHRGRRQPASRLNRNTASASGRKSRPPGVRPQRWTSSESC